MRVFVILFSIFILLAPSVIHAQTDLDELLAPIDFLEESPVETPKDQQYILEIKQVETKQGVTPSSLTAQELSTFNEYGYVIRRMDDETDARASIHFSIDSTLKSFDLVPGKREDLSPTIMHVTTSDSTKYQLVTTLTKELQTPSGYTMPIVHMLDGTRLGLTVFPSINQPLGAYSATIQVVALPW